MRWRSVGWAAAVATAATLAMSTSVGAATAPARGVPAAQVTSSYAKLVNHNGKCLDMTGGSKRKGVQPQIWSCNSNHWQYWRSVPVPNPTGGAAYLLRNYHSGLCLSILHNSTHSPAAVIQWPCNYSGNDFFEDWKPSCPGSYDGYCVWWDLGMEVSTLCCAMHPSGDRSSNGLKIYAHKFEESILAYRWKWGSHLP